VLFVAARAHEHRQQLRPGQRVTTQHVRDSAAGQNSTLPGGLFFQLTQSAT